VEVLEITMNKRFLGVVLGGIAGYGCGIMFYAVVALLWEALAGLFFGLDPYWHRLSVLKDILNVLIYVWLVVGVVVGYRVGSGYDYGGSH
jgi:hypothetical protein